MAARKAGLEAEALETQTEANRRSAFFVRAQADEHGSYGYRASGASACLNERVRRTYCL